MKRLCIYFFYDKDGMVDNYVPCVVEFKGLPETKDYYLVSKTDVLEHIPQENLDDVISHMSSLSKNFFINISCRRALSLLPNEKNAHCTIFPSRWWNMKLSKHFDVVTELDCTDIIACIFFCKKNNVKAMNFMKENNSD